MNSKFTNNNLFVLTNENIKTTDNYDLAEYDKHHVVEMKTFDMIKKQSEDNDSIIRDIYLSYFSQAEVLIKLINGHIDRNRYDKLRPSTQSLLELSAVVGAAKLKEVIKDTVYALMRSEYEKVSRLTPVLNSSYNEFKKSINEMI